MARSALVRLSHSPRLFLSMRRKSDTFWKALMVIGGGTALLMLLFVFVLAILYLFVAIATLPVAE